jgi:hypothetical protein
MADHPALGSTLGSNRFDHQPPDDDPELLPV